MGGSLSWGFGWGVTRPIPRSALAGLDRGQGQAAAGSLVSGAITRSVWHVRGVTPQRDP